MLKALDELPVKQRTVIVLRYFNDLSLKVKRKGLGQF